MDINSDDYSGIRLSKFPKTISLLGIFVFIFLSFFSIWFIYVVIFLLVVFIICYYSFRTHKLFFSDGYLCFAKNEKFAVKVSDIDAVEYKPVLSVGSSLSLVNISVRTIKGNTYYFGPVDDTSNLHTYIRKQMDIHRDFVVVVDVEVPHEKQEFKEQQTTPEKPSPKTISELSEAEAKHIFELMQNSSGVMLENMVEDIIRRSPNIHYVLLLRNLYVPKRYSDDYNEVDLVMIHNTGVYVFECKNYSGRVYGYADAQKWHVYYSNEESHLLLNPIQQNQSHITALSRYLNMDKSCFKSWIVFSNKSGCKIPESSSEYVICDCHELDVLLSSILRHGKVLLSSDEIHRIYQQLEKCTHVSYKERIKHAERIRHKYKSDEYKIH